MAQLNIYVPGEMAKEIRRQAKKERKTISAFVAGLFSGTASTKSWNKNFFTKVVGGWQGPCHSIDRPEPEERADW